MTRSKTPGVPEDRLEQYERLVATVPGLERKGAADTMAALPWFAASHAYARSLRPKPTRRMRS